MRFLIVAGLSIIAFFTAVMWLLVHQREAAHAGDATMPCHRESLLLDVMRMQGMLSSVDKRGADIVVGVPRKGWDRTNRRVQIEIATTAYCYARQARKGGRVYVEDEDGVELGQVVRGKWISKLYSE